MSPSHPHPPPTTFDDARPSRRLRTSLAYVGGADQPFPSGAAPSIVFEPCPANKRTRQDVDIDMSSSSRSPSPSHSLTPSPPSTSLFHQEHQQQQLSVSLSNAPSSLHHPRPISLVAQQQQQHEPTLAVGPPVTTSLASSDGLNFATCFPRRSASLPLPSDPNIFLSPSASSSSSAPSLSASLSLPPLPPIPTSMDASRPSDEHGHDPLQTLNESLTLSEMLFLSTLQRSVPTTRPRDEDEDDLVSGDGDVHEPDHQRRRRSSAQVDDQRETGNGWAQRPGLEQGQQGVAFQFSCPCPVPPPELSSASSSSEGEGSVEDEEEEEEEDSENILEDQKDDIDEIILATPCGLVGDGFGRARGEVDELSLMMRRTHLPFAPKGASTAIQFQRDATDDGLVDMSALFD